MLRWKAGPRRIGGIGAGVGVRVDWGGVTAGTCDASRQVAVGLVRFFGQASASQQTLVHDAGGGEHRNMTAVEAAQFDTASQAWGTLNPLLKRAVIALGYRKPTEIQQLSLSKTIAETWR